MSDLRAVARVVRWGAESMAFNLKQIPADKLDWKPNEACKTALQVVGEAAGVMRMMQPLFAGKEMSPAPLPHPETLEAALTLLTDAAEPFAAALEAAGPELDRAVPSPFGELWAAHSVLFPMIDLVHHHGQLTYIQSLLGDAENHMEVETVARWFGPPSAG